MRNVWTAALLLLGALITVDAAAQASIIRANNLGKAINHRSFSQDAAAQAKTAFELRHRIKNTVPESFLVVFVTTAAKQGTTLPTISAAKFGTKDLNKIASSEETAEYDHSGAAGDEFRSSTVAYYLQKSDIDGVVTKGQKVSITYSAAPVRVGIVAITLKNANQTANPIGTVETHATASADYPAAEATYPVASVADGSCVVDVLFALTPVPASPRWSQLGNQGAVEWQMNYPRSCSAAGSSFINKTGSSVTYTIKWRAEKAGLLCGSAVTVLPN